MSDIDEALEYFRRERAACDDKANTVGQELPVFTENMREAVRHMDTAIAALARQREEIDALSRLNRALDEKLAALEKQRVSDREYPISCTVCGRWLYEEDYEQLTASPEPTK